MMNLTQKLFYESLELGKDPDENAPREHGHTLPKYHREASEAVLQM